MGRACRRAALGGCHACSSTTAPAGFTDETATRLSGTANPAADDNAAVFLDVDSDGGADLLVASLSGPDRLCLNDGAGVFTLSPNATPNDAPDTAPPVIARHGVAGGAVVARIHDRQSPSRPHDWQRV